jgi:hypothetical protein
MTDEPTDPITTAALTLIKFSDGGWRPLLHQHVRDNSGHCHGCRPSSGATPIWPCRLWSIARKAELLDEDRKRTRAPETH